MLFRLDGIGVSFGRSIALRDIEFDFPERGVVALVGANGSGKSTLLDVLSGFIRPTWGRVVDAGGSAISMRMLGRRCARLHQASVLPDELTPAAYLAAAQRPVAGRWMFSKPMARIGVTHTETLLRAEVPLVSAMLDLALPRLGFDASLGVLSGGQRRAVALAAAALAPKQLLILDEPFVGCGPSVTDAAIEMIRMEGTRRTVVVAEHNLHLLPRFVDVVLVLNKGTVAAVHCIGELAIERLMEHFG